MVDELGPVLSHAAAVGDVTTIKKILSGSVWTYTAPAIGYACRFGGIESVEALIQGGAKLFIDTDTRFEYQNSYENARVANYALMLLDSCSWRARFEDGWCFDFNKWYKSNTPGKRRILSKEERIKILDILLQNQKTIGFEPGDLLYYAILAEDAEFVDALRQRGITFSQAMYSQLFEIKYYKYWSMLCGIETHKKMTIERLVCIIENICQESKGASLRCTMALLERNQVLFKDVDLMRRLLACLNHSDLNKLQLMRRCVNACSAGHLALFEELGWLSRPLTRDKLIAYAEEINDTEMIAWLLDYKNRTADFAAEQQRADKRMEGELNASLDSVYMLSKLWGYKKNEDNTLKIISYKGNEQDISLPAKIGNRAVTEVADFAFTPYYRGHAFKSIRSVALPEGVKHLGRSVFFSMDNLEAVNLPSTLTNFEDMCFAKCGSLKSIFIPEGVTYIPFFAFEGCSSLAEVQLPQGLESIDKGAFSLCYSLKELYIPMSVTSISKYAVESSTTLLVHNNSNAHFICEKLGLNYKIID